MDDPLDKSYLEWLYGQVAVVEFDEQDLTYWKLLRILFTTEFFWSVDHDKNRSSDGIALRYRFLEESGISDVDPIWMSEGCSVLEMMVALAKRMEFESESGGLHYWFWVLVENIGLSGFSDHRRFTKRQRERIDRILEDVIDRNYEKSGHGGFFPLKHPRYDQRKRELWYQMSDYILEQEELAG